MRRISTVFEINDVDIKLFQAQKVHGKEKVIFFNVRPVIHCSSVQIVTLLKDMVASLLFVPEKPVLLVPRRFVILRQMRLPSHDHSEIEDMIGLQLVNNIPYSVEDIIYRYHLLDQDSNGYSLVLVIIIPREVIHRYQQVMQEVGIKNGILTLNSFGILDWLIYQDSVRKMANGQAVALLNIDSQYSEVCFCYDKKLFFSRNISCCGKHLTLKDTEELIEQVGLSLDIYREERLGPEVRKIVISSACSEAEVLKGQLENKLKLPVKIAEPLENIFYSSSVDKIIIQEHYPFSIIAGLGLLLSEKKDCIDLIPRETCAEKQRSTQGRWIMKFAALFSIIMFLSVSGQLIDIRRGKTRLELMENRSDRLQPQLKKAREKIRLVRSFDQKLSRYNFVPDLISEFSRLTPDEISFRRLSLDGTGNLVIQGYAKTHAGINDFQSRLIRSSQFHDVDLQFVTNRKIANMSVMDFKIAMQLYNDKKEVP